MAIFENEHLRLQNEHLLEHAGKDILNNSHNLTCLFKQGQYHKSH